jgi:tRNA(Arg) A34 adenosine deaminase TadA
LRRSIEIAAQSRVSGNHPFGALLAGANGDILAVAQNTVVTESDVTGHAELNLVRIASRELSDNERSAATLYTSTEPCAMCAGAIYWSGISRVVFALSEAELAARTGADPENPTMSLSAATVLNAGQRHIEIDGPFLADEAAVVHEGFWNPPHSDL